jgi:hypothetical protein
MSIRRRSVSEAADDRCSNGNFVSLPGCRVTVLEDGPISPAARQRQRTTVHKPLKASIVSVSAPVWASASVLRLLPGTQRWLLLARDSAATRRGNRRACGLSRFVAWMPTRRASSTMLHRCRQPVLYHHVRLRSIPTRSVSEDLATASGWYGGIAHGQIARACYWVSRCSPVKHRIVADQVRIFGALDFGRCLRKRVGSSAQFLVS